MPIEVEGPDGKVHSFPDGTSHEAINQRMSTAYGGAGRLDVYSPKPGDATPASGAIMPNMQNVPTYRTREDNLNLALGAMYPHMQNLIQNTPGHALRMEQAKTVGKNLGQLEERQRAGIEVLDMLHQLGETANEGHEAGTLNSAIGPLNEMGVFQKAREIANVGDMFGTRKSYNLHNQLNHDIEGLVTAFVASASKGGITMSDARQKAFHDTMGAMMAATSKEEFDKIKKDADRIIRGTFGLAPGAAVEPTRSSRTQAPPHAAPTARPRYYNPQTKETIEWDGTQYVRVQ